MNTKELEELRQAYFTALRKATETGYDETSCAEACAAEKKYYTAEFASRGKVLPAENKPIYSAEEIRAMHAKLMSDRAAYEKRTGKKLPPTLQERMKEKRRNQ